MVFFAPSGDLGFDQPDLVFAPDPARVPRFPDVPVLAASAPPPISGGTLIALRDESRAVAADPDRDLVYVVDLVTNRLTSTVTLPAGSEPGRLAEGADGRVHVALRGTGLLLSIDSATGATLRTRAVCPAPRGVAYDPVRGILWVACVDGTLAMVPEQGDGKASTFSLDDDLRDVVLDGGWVYVSRFRSAQVLVVDPVTGRIAERLAPGHPGGSSASVAWRMRANPTNPGGGGGVLVVHQLAVTGLVAQVSGGYSGGDGDLCGGTIVETAVSALIAEGALTVTLASLRNVALAVDFAVDPTNRSIALATPANYKSGAGTMGVRLAKLDRAPFAGCMDVADLPGRIGQATSVVATAHEVIFQSREPAALYLSSANITIPLSSESREDTGHAVFHNRAGINLACASCHPEGGEDGRVWQFAGSRSRRTQSLRGGVLATAPFHWDGSLKDLGDVAREVFQKRMDGPSLTPPQVDALGRFVDAIPRIAVPAPADPASVARGKALFESDSTKCASCHSGPHFTSNRNEDLGQGSFQVPSLLGLAVRAPYLHDGCAETLRDRFEKCQPTKTLHGDTSGLTSADITDLVAYLRTL